MLQKIISIFMALYLLLTGGAARAQALPDFREITGLDGVQRLLDGGAGIDRVFYTDGFGFSTSEFTTTDGNEIAALWRALNAIEIAGTSDQSVTDWYPQIVFSLSNGETHRVNFDAHWLEIGMQNFTLSNDGDFWALTAELVAKHAEDPQPNAAEEYVPVSVDLYFKENPTTGYVWVYAVEDESVAVITDQYFEDGELFAVGKGGSHWFHIDAAAPGTTSVTFTHGRPWEETPLQTITLRFTADDALNVSVWGVEAQ